MAKKEKLSRIDQGIALNLTLEWVPKLAYAINKPPFSLIKPLNEWYESKLLMDSGNAGINELGYVVAASIKSAIDMAFYGVIYEGQEQINVEDYTIDKVLKLADLIVASALAKY